MNGITTNSGTTSSTTSLKNWIDHANELSNRLIINGRLYSFNTRGGSLAITATDLVKLTTNTGKIFNGSQLTTTSTPSDAAKYDLERFRVMLNDSNSQCTTSINYDPLSAVPEILQKPTGYTGGNCSF